MITRFAKIREVKSPIRGHSTDAGIDFFVPEFTEELMLKMEQFSRKGIPRNKYGFKIRAHSNVLIPSGIKIEVLPGWMAMFADKSGIASQKELIVGAKVVDTNYSGEVHLDIHNISDQDVEVLFGQKMVQLIFIPVGMNPLIEVDQSLLYNYIEENNNEVRGEGGFGSTGS